MFSTDPRIMNRAAFEAVGLGRPLVLSNLPALKTRFASAAVFCDNDLNGVYGSGDILESGAVVTLTGTLRPEADHEQDLMSLTLRLIWDIDGVVDVVNRLGQ